jgi:hypothetical protein
MSQFCPNGRACVLFPEIDCRKMLRLSNVARKDLKYIKKILKGYFKSTNKNIRHHGRALNNDFILTLVVLFMVNSKPKK